MASQPHPFIRSLVAGLALTALVLAMDTLRLFAGLSGWDFWFRLKLSIFMP